MAQEGLRRVVCGLGDAAPRPKLRAEINRQLVSGHAAAFGHFDRRDAAHADVNLLEDREVNRACLIVHKLQGRRARTPGEWRSARPSVEDLESVSKLPQRTEAWNTDCTDGADVHGLNQ